VVSKTHTFQFSFTITNVTEFVENFHTEIYYELYVEFEVITAVVIRRSIFGAVTPCRPLKVDRRFEGTCCLYLQGKISEILVIATCFMPISCLAYSSLIQFNCLFIYVLNATASGQLESTNT
jgi:hypothetical protein